MAMGVALSFGGLSLGGLSFGGLAGTPEDVYWRARIEAIARVRALAAEKAEATLAVEDVALDALGRALFKIVGPVKVEGFSSAPASNVTQLQVGPDQGQLDAANFSRPGKAGTGGLTVTTKALLRLWLAQYKPSRAPWASDALHALKSDTFYGDALSVENGYDGVADIPLPKPEGASLAVAKLGRWGEHVDSIPHPVLIVTVVKGNRVFIETDTPALKLPEIPGCANEAASIDGTHSGDQWGPLDFEALQAWRACERKTLPGEPYFADLKRQAREIAGRLARAQ